ncbi:hypothetical protein BC940DRAFT_304196 [Gongronella butleri]|nr:hypothetical protein BC940DRAFT_304196 [Gongronella butleri]
MTTPQEPVQRQVQIRSPSLEETLVVSFDETTTIADLKKRIQATHPSKPTPADQRIIFRGSVLTDVRHVAALLDKTHSLATFHLVVKPSISTTTSTATDNTTQRPTGHAAMTPTPSLPPASFVTAASPPMAHSPPTWASTAPMASATAATSPSTTLVPGGYHIVALDGHYYLAPVLVPASNQSQPHLTAAGRAAYSQPHQTQPQPPYVQDPAAQWQTQQPMAPQQAQFHAQPAAAAAAPAHAAAPGVPLMGARPPRVMQRGATIWLALKLMFALFITCQGASLERIVFFHFLAVVFFLYQTGRFRLVVRRVNFDELQRGFQQPFAPANANAAPQQQPQQHQDEHRQEQAQTDAAQTSGAHGSSGSNGSAQENATTPLAVLKRGAYTFVASLWPNYGRDPRLAQAFEQDEVRETG